MDDKEWLDIRRYQEREALLASLKMELKRVPEDVADRVEAEFFVRLENGGVESVYALAEAIDWYCIPILYPLVTEHFVRALHPPEQMTKRGSVRRAKQLSQLANSIKKSSSLALAVSNGPSWCTALGENLGSVANELERQANEDSSTNGPGVPGKPMHCSTRLALGLNGLLLASKLPMTRRSSLIAAVVSSFIEPVTGEQIRQRIKDLVRRPPKSKAREAGPSSS